MKNRYMSHFNFIFNRITLEYILFLSANFNKKILKDIIEINNWVNNTLTYIKKNGLDGANIDFEDEIDCSDVTSIWGFNELVYSLGLQLKQNNPKSQAS